MNKNVFRTVLSLVVCLLAGVIAVAEENAAANVQIELEWGVKIPMRDGVQLNATVYRPEGGGPLPVIFTLTPYIADSYHERAWYFSRNGFVFVLVDARGRGSSEGKFRAFAQEAEDGHDVVEWLAVQPWSNGKVAMWGGSYAGYNQWATAKELPPHLETIVPAAAAHAGTDFPFWRNIPYPYEIQWQTLTGGTTGNFNLFEQDEFWNEKFWELYRDHRPFVDLPEITGNLTTAFVEWAAHPMQGAYWDAMNPTATELARIDLPILTITGHYDGDQPGAMEFYKQHMEFGSGEARAEHYLIIGPWDHAGTRTPRTEFGGWKFSEASLLDLNKLHKEWYDWTMKGGDKPEFLQDRLAYFVAGAGEWRYASSLDSVATELRRLYLHSNGEANDAFHSGWMLNRKPDEGAASDGYVYDPLDSRPGELERTPRDDRITNQTGALNLFGGGLVYHSEPFVEDTEISGYLKLVAWLEIDVPDTDFAVGVYEILPDGTSIALTQDMMRARYRESLREAKAVPEGEIIRYEFNGFLWFSRLISKGSRLRLVFKSPNSIFFQKNYNSGGVVAEESAADARTAHVKLYHDAEHPSYVELPVVQD